MPRHIDIAHARALLRSRDQLRHDGLSERDIHRAVAEGALVRVHRGTYVAADQWNDLWAGGRHLLRVLAVHRASPAPGPIFSHASAAVLWGLPLYGQAPAVVHTVIEGDRHTRTSAGVMRHNMRLVDDDVVVQAGIRCTSIARTVLDVARSQRLETAVSCADAALRMRAVMGHQQNPDAASQWRTEVENHARRGLRGVRQARWVIGFADGRAQLPGESVSRLRLHQLGYSDLDLQVNVAGSAGNDYWLDFAFLRSHMFGEFDGQSKYRDAEIRAGLSIEDVVLREKRREDDVRGVTGWRIVRWENEHLRIPDALGQRLRAFGLRPPG